MKLPTSAKSFLPSLRIEGDGRISLERRDLRKLLEPFLKDVIVDEAWYGLQYPDVKATISKGLWSSGRDHYFITGFLEGRLPSEPDVDEAFYRDAYPDVANAVEKKVVVDCRTHFIKEGYREGRLPTKPVERSTSTASSEQMSNERGTRRAYRQSKSRLRPDR